jgi:hypothetical protein
MAKSMGWAVKSVTAKPATMVIGIEKGIAMPGG